MGRCLHVGGLWLAVVVFAVGLRKEISAMVGGLHFGGRRSGLCHGSEEGDLCSEEVDLCWFVGMVGMVGFD